MSRTISKSSCGRAKLLRRLDDTIVDEADTASVAANVDTDSGIVSTVTESVVDASSVVSSVAVTRKRSRPRHAEKALVYESITLVRPSRKVPASRAQINATQNVST